MPGAWASGPTPALAKNSCAAIHMVRAGTVTLNRTRTGAGCRPPVARRSDITSASTATVTAPAAGPKSRAAAIVNVSEMEKLAGIARSRSVAQPDTPVNATSITHCGAIGLTERSISDQASTKLPARITAARNVPIRDVSVAYRRG